MHPMGCFEKAASEKMASMEKGPKMLIIRLAAPSMGGESEMESEGYAPGGESEDKMSSTKAKALFDLVTEAIGMKHEWTPEIEKKLVEKLSSMHGVGEYAEEED